MHNLDEINRLLIPNAKGKIDLTKIWIALGRPQHRSPTVWSQWFDGEPPVKVVDGPSKPVWSDEGTARDYAHYLLPAIGPGRIDRAELKRRGWTDALIDQFLPEEDGSKAKPVYQSASRVRLYLVSRVVSIEQAAEFQVAKAKAGKRQAAAARSVATKRDKMEQYLQTVVVDVPKHTREEVQRLALEHWNALRRHDWEPGEGQAWVDKITVNYLRHELSCYEEELKVVSRKVDARDAFMEISRLVFSAISTAYPWLAEECNRQMAKRVNEDMNRLN
jgi:hypothetical protein